MLHDWVLAAGGGDAPSVTAPTSVIGLIIITVPATIGAVTLLLNTLAKRRDRPQDEEPPPLPLPPGGLNSHEAGTAQGSPDRRRVTVLENWMWLHRFNPTKVVRGDEELDVVRIRR